MRFFLPDNPKYDLLKGAISDNHYIYLIFTNTFKYLVCKYRRDNYVKVAESEPLPAGIGGNPAWQDDKIIIPSGTPDYILHTLNPETLKAGLNVDCRLSVEPTGISRHKDMYVVYTKRSPRLLIYDLEFNLKRVVSLPKPDHWELLTAGYMMYDSKIYLIVREKREHEGYDTYITCLEFPSGRILDVYEFSGNRRPHAFLTIFNTLYLLTKDKEYIYADTSFTNG